MKVVQTQSAKDDGPVIYVNPAFIARVIPTQDSGAKVSWASITLANVPGEILISGDEYRRILPQLQRLEWWVDE